MGDADHTEKVLARIESAPARAALRQWLKDHSATMSPEDWTGYGYTTAQLLSANLHQHKDHSVVVIIKINENCDGAEYNAHFRARKDSEEFAREHLARLVAERIVVPGGGSVILQSTAGGGLGTMNRIDVALLDHHDPREVCYRITMALLTEWNTASEPSRVRAGRALAKLLGDRLAYGGTIAAWATRHDGLLVDPRPWLDSGPRLLINPFFLVGAQSWGDRLTVSVVCGKTHGDYHPGNILVDAGCTSFCLVDLSRYSDTGLLTWDPVYLTLTAVAGALPGLQPRAREVVQSWCLDPGPQIAAEGLSGYLRAMLIGVHQAGAGWAKGQGNNVGWERQRQLCLIAIALVLTGRGELLSPETRTWFFWLAARAATRLVEANSIRPDETEPLRLPRNLFADDPGIKTGAPDVDPAASRPARPQAGDIAAEDAFFARLTDALRSTRFITSDRSTMAARTENLRTMLARADEREVMKGDVKQYLDNLKATLDAALRPGAKVSEMRAACERADLFRELIIRQLS